MSLFSNKLSEVDENKRKKDRDALMLAAQRNVKAQLEGMDRKVYNETGKVNPTMLTEWELRAHQAANANHAARIENKGKVDIGGCKFMNPDEVDAIASKRVQPILDDINEKAEVERERQAVLKMEEEARKAELEKEKTREREIKEINKTLRDQAKQEEKAKKTQERAARAEQKRQTKEEKRTLKVDSTGEQNIRNEDATEDIQEEAVTDAPATMAAPTDMKTERRSSNESATSPTSRVKGWIRNRFSRGKSIGDGDKQTDKRRSFLGGAALRDSDVNRSTTSLDNRSASMRDVALAGRTNAPDTNDDNSTRDSRGVSPISSDESVRDFVMTPPRPIGDHVRSSHSPSRFREMIDQ